MSWGCFNFLPTAPHCVTPSHSHLTPNTQHPRPLSPTLTSPHPTHRSFAERKLYELIIAAKETYQSHPLIHTFCRLMSLVKGPTIEQQQESEAAAARTVAKLEAAAAAAAAGKKGRVAGPTPYTSMRFVPEKGANGKGAAAGAGVGAGVGGVGAGVGAVSVSVVPKPVRINFNNCEISLPIATVYFYARSCLLRPYSGIFGTT